MEVLGNLLMAIGVGFLVGYGVVYVIMTFFDR